MAYVHLMKPRSVLLLLVTALAAMVMAGPGVPSLAAATLLVLGGAMAAGGANVLNCYLDRDLDRRMARTARRPLPAGKLIPLHALLFGLSLSVISVAVFAFGLNRLSAALAASGVLYYVVVYTLSLKRSTHWNVVIGGVAGALPLLVGWTAAGGQLSWWPVWLGALVVCWTPPHFWSLALLRQREYAEARIPMLPVVRGEKSTARQILGYALALVALTLLLYPAGFVGFGFSVLALVLGTVLVCLAVRLLRHPDDGAARRLYRYSIVYLSLLFLGMILDRLLLF